jgi:hypothetical protein
MMTEEITHREILDRVVVLEEKIDHIKVETSAVVMAFEAASGAFIVLEWFGKIVKPFLWIAGLVAAAGAMWNEWRR